MIRGLQQRQAQFSRSHVQGTLRQMDAFLSILTPVWEDTLMCILSGAFYYGFKPS